MSLQTKMHVPSQPRQPLATETAQFSLLQRSVAKNEEASKVPAIVHEVLRSSGQPLDAATRAFMEPRFGYNFGQVRVHNDSRAAASAQATNASAYTVGRDVVFGAGHYAPNTVTGKQLLAHELTHVVQQNSTMAPQELIDYAQEGQTETEARQAADLVLVSGAAMPKIGPLTATPARLARQVVGTSVATSTATPTTTPEEKERERRIAQIKAEAKVTADAIAAILRNNWNLGFLNQDEILSLMKPWATDKPDIGTKFSPFDYLVAALYQVYGENKSLRAFDELFDRMSAGHVQQIKDWMRKSGRDLRNVTAVETAKFEISKEEALEGAQLALEVAAAFASGGGSVLLQIIAWLAKTLPELFQKAKAALDFVDTIRSIKLDDLKNLISPKGVADLLVKALFGEFRLQNAVKPDEASEEQDKQADKEPANAREEKGLIQVFHGIIRLFKVLKRMYVQVVALVSKGLATVDITKQAWFPTFSMVYAAAVKAIEAVSDPVSVLNTATQKIREVIGSFFSEMRGKVDTTATSIKAALEFVGQPAQLMRTLANRAVEMVLNFIISHPPSALVKVAFKAIEAGAKKSIVELVREKIPIADKLFNEIAESSVVKGLLKPLEPAVNAVGNLTERMVGQANVVITDAETRAVGLLGSGAQFVGEVAGVPVGQPSTQASEEAATPRPAQPTTAPEQPEGNFLSTMRQRVHTRLLAIGERNLLQKGKELGKAALEKGKDSVKGLAAKVKGLILGPKLGFKLQGEHHDLWVEQREQGIAIIVATTPELIEEKLSIYRPMVNSLTESQNKATALQVMSVIEQKINSMKTIAHQNSSQLEAEKQILVGLIVKLESILEIPTEKGGLLELSLPNGVRIVITKEWDLIPIDSQPIYLDTYRSHKARLIGTYLDVHHLLEKRFLAPLNNLRERKYKKKNHPTTDVDEMISVVLPAKKSAITHLINIDPKGKILKKSPLFHQSLSKGEQAFSISKQLQDRVTGIGNRYSNAVAEDHITPKEVYEMHKEIYEVLGKPSWINAIRIYFRDLFD